MARARVRLRTHARALVVASDATRRSRIFFIPHPRSRIRERAVAANERAIERVERAIAARDRHGEGIARGVARDVIRTVRVKTAVVRKKDR